MLKRNMRTHHNRNDSRDSSLLERESYGPHTRSSVASFDEHRVSLASIPKQAPLSPKKTNESRKLRLKHINIRDVEERGDILDDLPPQGDFHGSNGSPLKISEKTGMSFKRPNHKIPNLSMPRGFYDKFQ